MKSKIIEYSLLTVIGISFGINIVLMNLFPVYSNALLIIGYIILAAGAVLVILSVFTILKRMNKEVVNSGVYSVVRHPMYVGGMVMFFLTFSLARAG
ncbi:MAG: methyltransferase [Actinomycetota bacterium]|nr:methyltransferase [Actinomycetota bacterium]